jgi:hypothetical protein
MWAVLLPTLLWLGSAQAQCGYETTLLKTLHEQSCYGFNLTGNSTYGPCSCRYMYGHTRCECTEQHCDGVIHRVWVRKSLGLGSRGWTDAWSGVACGGWLWVAVQ